MVSMRSLVAVVGLVALGVAAGVLLLQSPRPAAQTGYPDSSASGPAVAEDVALELATAQEQAPYGIRLPAWVPAGYELRRVSFDSDPAAPGGHAFSLDLKYVNADDEVVHIWQSNLTAEQMGATDPLAIPGSRVVAVGASSWLATELAELDGVGRTQLSYRDVEGVIITVDGPELGDLIAVAASLAPAN